MTVYLNCDLGVSSRRRKKDKKKQHKKHHKRNRYGSHNWNKVVKSYSKKSQKRTFFLDIDETQIMKAVNRFGTDNIQQVIDVVSLYDPYCQTHTSMEAMQAFCSLKWTDVWDNLPREKIQNLIYREKNISRWARYTVASETVEKVTETKEDKTRHNNPVQIYTTTSKIAFAFLMNSCKTSAKRCEMLRFLSDVEQATICVKHDMYSYIPTKLWTLDRITPKQMQEMVKQWESFSDLTKSFIGPIFQERIQKDCYLSRAEGKTVMDRFIQKCKTSSTDGWTEQCCICKDRVWYEELVYFNNGNHHPCGRGCQDCVVKSFANRMKDIRACPVATSSDDIKEEEQEKPTLFKCINPECTHDTCIINWDSINSRIQKEISRACNEKVEKIKELYVEAVNPSLMKLANKYCDFFDKDVDSDDSKTRYVSNFANFVRWFTYAKSKSKEKWMVVSNKYRKYMIAKHMREAEEELEKIKKIRSENDPDKLFSSLEELNRVYGLLCGKSAWFDDTTHDLHKEEAFGTKLRTIWDRLLERLQFYAELCLTETSQCSICCTTSHPKDVKFLDMHNGCAHKNTLLKCTVCEDCFGSYVQHSGALHQQKPQLTCPGMNCGRRLDEDYIRKIAPKAFAIHENSMLKYRLKRVRDFKFCPNAKCGHGFQIYEGCASMSLTCPECDTSFCKDCGQEPHEHIGNCLDYLKHEHKKRWQCILADEDPDKETQDKITTEEEQKKADEKEAEIEKQIEQLFEQKNCQQCPHCLVWIEKNGGCDHMTCRHCCGEFCWICQAEWSTHRQCGKSKPVVRPTFFETVGRHKIDQDDEHVPDVQYYDCAEMDPTYRDFLNNTHFKPEKVVVGGSAKKELFKLNETQQEVITDLFYQRWLADADDSSDEDESESSVFGFLEQTIEAFYQNKNFENEEEDSCECPAIFMHSDSESESSDDSDDDSSS